MSGFYNNWVKVQNPNLPNDIPPMQSGGFQAPFFFGGSQVPVNLGLSDTNISGSGLGTSIRSDLKIDFKPTKMGKGVQYTGVKGHRNIHIPRTLKY
jgi:hypothetical protein